MLFTPKRKAQRGRDPGSRLRTRALITWSCSACKVRQTISSWVRVTVCVCPPLRNAVKEKKNAVKDTPPLGKLGAWLSRGEGALQPAGWCSVDACVVDVQLFSCVRLSVTPWTAARQASQSLAIFQSLSKFMSIDLAMLSSHLIPCFPLLQSLSKFMSIDLAMLSSHLTPCCPLLLLPSVFPSISGPGSGHRIPCPPLLVGCLGFHPGSDVERCMVAQLIS